MDKSIQDETVADKLINTAGLRRRAEERLRQRKDQRDAPQTDGEMRNMLFELELKNAELEIQCEELQKSQARFKQELSRYRALYDSAPVAYLKINRAAKIERANAKSAHLVGVDVDQLRCRHLREFVGEQDRLAFNAFIETIFASEVDGTEFEATLEDTYGHHPRVIFKATCSMDQNECWLTLIETNGDSGRDVAERKLSDIELQSNRRRLEAAMNMASMADWEFDLVNLRFTFNDRFYELTGTTAEREGGYEITAEKVVQDFCHPDDGHLIEAEIANALTNPDTSRTYTLEYRFLQRDTREVRNVFVAYQVACNDAGQAVTAFGVHQDVTILKQTEAKLKQSEDLFRVAIDSLHEGFVLQVADSRIVICNQSAARILGLTIDQLSGLTSMDSRWQTLREDGSIFPNTEHPAWITLRQGIAQNDVVMGVHKPSGELAWISINSVPIGPKKAPTAAVVTFTDITGRRHAEQAIRASEERYRRLVSVIPGALFINASGRIVFCNSAFVQLMGAKDASEVLGRNPFDLIHPDFHDLARSRITEMSRTGETPPQVEIQFVRLDGRAVLVYSVASPMTGVGSSDYLVVLSDLTERERSTSLLRSVLRSVNDAIVTINENGIIQSVNPAVMKMFGYEDSELVGHNISLLMPERYFGEQSDYVGEYLKSGDAKVIGIGREVEGRRKDGSTLPLELNVTEFRLDSMRHFTGVMRDITDRRQAESELREGRQRLEHLSRQLITTRETELQHLSRELHDEIGQVLTAMKMNLRRTQRSIDVPAQASLEENVVMIDKAIAQVRNLSLHLRPPHLSELGLVATLHWYLRHQAKNAGVQTHLDVNPTDLQVPQDLAIVCFRITQEAVTNAIRHAGPSKLNIELRLSGNQLYLAIRDDGVGFDISQAMQSALDGVSLGLINMQERANLAGGHLDIESLRDKGTTVHAWFSLPDTN